VARRWTFSIKERYLTVYGDHKLLAYSRLGRTRAQYNNFLTFRSGNSLHTLLTRPSVLLALPTILSIYLDHDKSFDTVTPRSIVKGTQSNDWLSMVYTASLINVFFLEMFVTLHLDLLNAIPQSKLHLCKWSRSLWRL
jgi:hypothetical protein